jgi:hypothetical protein
LRDQLAAELREIKSIDEAGDWAYRVLEAKNSLTAADVFENHESSAALSFTRSRRRSQ